MRNKIPIGAYLRSRRRKNIKQNGSLLLGTKIASGPRRTRPGGGGGCSPPPPPWHFQNSHIRAKNQVIFGQNHWIFGQAMEKIFGQLTSAPLNETGPVRLYAVVDSWMKALYVPAGASLNVSFFVLEAEYFVRRPHSISLDIMRFEYFRTKQDLQLHLCCPRKQNGSLLLGTKIASGWLNESTVRTLRGFSEHFLLFFRSKIFCASTPFHLSRYNEVWIFFRTKQDLQLHLCCPRKQNGGLLLGTKIASG